MDVEPDRPHHSFMTLAYDDIASIFYFGRMMPGYWARNGKNILTAVEESILQYEAIHQRCEGFDNSLNEQAGKYGSVYQKICVAAYRQAIAAHKLIADENGDIVFLSKECFSNGCIGTVDITYPSVPLFLIYNPELVRGMLRPVLRFARMPVWEYDFAPHDVGRYPYVSGQVYGLMPNPSAAKSVGTGEKNYLVFPMYYLMPEGSGIYDLKYQMPVEECGNMLIVAASLVRFGGEGERKFFADNMDLYKTWAEFLLKYGADPGEQLCTDDFAGHLAHNVNLAAKAAMGLASYAIILEADGRREDAEKYRHKASEIARNVYERANAGDHTRITFDGAEDTWSLKYNTIWDILFGTKMWPQEFYKNEIDWYKKCQNRYGIPLDSRKSYTKSDWIIWCAAMSDNLKDIEHFAQPIARFLAETEDKVPFSDWYDTLNGKHQGFRNRAVQGGLFMPLLREVANLAQRKG